MGDGVKRHGPLRDPLTEPQALKKERTMLDVRPHGSVRPATPIALRTATTVANPAPTRPTIAAKDLPRYLKEQHLIEERALAAAAEAEVERTRLQSTLVAQSVGVARSAGGRQSRSWLGGYGHSPARRAEC